jgi:hypothetical protein
VRSLATSGWTVRRFDCLDVRVAPAHDRLVPPGAVAFAFDFVNTCRGAAPVDFTNVRAETRLDDGRSVPWALFDPGHEVHPAALGAGDEGAEAIEFDPPASSGPPAETQSVCLDFRAMSPARAEPPPVCFRRAGAALVPAEAAEAIPVGEGRNLPDREVSLVVGYRHFSRFGDGWEQAPPPRVRSLYAPGAQQTAFRSYPIGSLLAAADSPTAGARRVGCVDVRVEAVSAYVADTSVVLIFTLGNRCTRPARIALADAPVTVTWESGVRRALALYDPASEVHTPVLDGRANATESLQYVARVDAPPGPARSVCVDVSHLVAGQSADVPPICVSKTGGFVLEDSVVGHESFDPEIWRRPSWRVLMELGATMNFVELPGASWGGTTPAGKAFNLAASPYKRTLTFGVDLHLFPWWSGSFYGGFMMRGGGGPVDPNAHFAAAGTTVGGDSAVSDVSGGVVGGLVWARSTAVRLRADLALGLRGVLTNVFPPGCSNSTCAWNVDGARPLVEPRLVFDEWFSPWWSVTAWIDADALYLPDVGIGLALAFHSWAYDGVP